MQSSFSLLWARGLITLPRTILERVREGGDDGRENCSLGSFMAYLFTLRQVSLAVRNPLKRFRRFNVNVDRNSYYCY